MKRIFLGLLVISIFTSSLMVNAHGNAGKYLIILQAGKETHEGLARAVHALLYSRELKENGHEVVLIFDGAGTEWIEKWAKADSTDKLANSYRELRELGVTQVVCDFCASAFHVKESLKKQDVTLNDEYQGHPSIVKWINQGYQIIVL